MAFREPWDGFGSGFSEVLWLLGQAKSANALPVGNRAVTDQQVYIRAAIVLLAAHLEGFFRTLANSYADAIPDRSWNAQLPGIRRYVALTVSRHIEQAVTEAEQCENAAKVNSLRNAVVLASRWLLKPSRISESMNRPALSGFYRQRGAQSIENLLQSFHSDNTKFFPWLEQQGLDRGRYWTTIEGVVNARNEIAHGDAQLSLTLADVRTYAATCARLVRRVRRYVAV